MADRRKDKDVVVLTDVGMMPPHNLDFETAVIASCLIDTGAFDRICDTVSPECFYDKKNRTVFAAICDLGYAREAIDLMTVTEQLRKKGELQEVGGDVAIVDYSTKVKSSFNVVAHARAVKELFMCREVMKFCAVAEKEAFDRTIPVADMIKKVEDGLYHLVIDNERKNYSSMNEMLSEAMHDIEEAARHDGLNGVPSGFHLVDKMTCGWQKTDLVIIAARPAMGKTALILSMAMNMINSGHKVGIFSLEMGKVQLMKRLLSNVSKIPAATIKSGKLTDLDWRVLNHASNALHDQPLYIDDSSDMTIFEVATKARRMVREHQIDCMFIDYLQLVHAEGKTINNREQEVSTISRALKQLAKELDIPIIALSQLNRGVEARTGENKRPMLSDLRESGAIEQDADMVLLLHRPEYYDILVDPEGNSTIGMAELIIAKNRNGATGTVKLHFESEYIKFSDYDSDYFSQFPTNDPFATTAAEQESTKTETKNRQLRKKSLKETARDVKDDVQDDDDDWDVITK